MFPKNNNKTKVSSVHHHRMQERHKQTHVGFKSLKSNKFYFRMFNESHLSAAGDDRCAADWMQRGNLVVGLDDRRLTADGGDWSHGRRAGSHNMWRCRSDGRLSDARRSRLHHPDLCLSYAPRLHDCLRYGTYLGLKEEF